MRVASQRERQRDQIEHGLQVRLKVELGAFDGRRAGRAARASAAADDALFELTNASEVLLELDLVSGAQLGERPLTSASTKSMTLFS